MHSESHRLQCVGLKSRSRLPAPRQRHILAFGYLTGDSEETVDSEEHVVKGR